VGAAAQHRLQGHRRKESLASKGKKPGVKDHRSFCLCHAPLEGGPRALAALGLPGLQGPQARASQGHQTGHTTAAEAAAITPRFPAAASQVRGCGGEHPASPITAGQA